MSTRITSFTAAMLVALWASGTAHSADPVAPSRAPAYVIQAGGICSPCEVAQVPCARPCPQLSASPKPCENQRYPLAHLRAAPTAVPLCPGGCFGYFPTQWRNWDAACGTIHYGAIPTDPLIPPAYDMPPKNGQIPAPRSSSNPGTRIK